MRRWRNPVVNAATSPGRFAPRPALTLRDRLGASAAAGLRRWGRRWWPRPKPKPEAAGVREPRRPKPTLPAAAVALAEPRTEIRRRIRLRSHRAS